MTALTAGRYTQRMGDSAHPDLLAIPIADNVHVYANSLVGLNAAGYCIPAGSGCTKIVGLAEKDYDNTVAGHALGALTVRVRQGVFGWANDAGGAALTVADVGSVCYALDDQTVTRASAGGTLPVAGTVLGVETGKVFVDTMLWAPTNSAGSSAFEAATTVTIVEAAAGKDILATAKIPTGQHVFVKGIAISVGGATAWAGALTVLKVQDLNGTPVEVFEVAKAKLAGSAVLGLFDMTLMAGWVAGCTATKGLQIKSDSTISAGSDLTVRVWGDLY